MGNNDHNALRVIYLFYKPAHGIPVAGWDNISIATIGSGKVRIKLNVELWLHPSV